MFNPVYKYISYFLLGVLAYGMLSPLVTIGNVQPYTQEEVLKEDWTKDGTAIHAVFFKNGSCKIINFSVVGFSGGIPKYLHYRDLDGLPEDFDREEGWQGLNIFVEVDPLSLDFFELRTRHVCLVGDEGETEVITKVFSRHEPK